MNTHTTLIAQLSEEVRSGKIATSYIVTGGSVTEREIIATGFAQALQCQEAKYFQQCTCEICRRIAARHHPDVLWCEIPPKSFSIKIDTVRTLIKWMQFKPFEAARKVYLLPQAEQLTIEAANALLKVLEEPPLHSIILLLTSRLTQLLPTIVSRCRLVHLRTQHAAKALLETEEMQDANVWLDQFFGDRPLAFLEELSKQDRQDVVRVMDALLSYCHDVMVQQVSGDAADLIHEDRARASQALAHHYSPAAVQRLFWSAQETRAALLANVNQKLALTHLELALEP